MERFITYTLELFYMGNPLTDMQKRVAYRLYEREGVSATEIAALFGERRSNISYYFTARKHGFKKATDYQHHTIKKQGFKNWNGYRNYLAQQQGFKDRGAYHKRLAKEHQARLENKIVSAFIVLSLDGLGMTQRELARQLGMSSSAINSYIQRKTLPSPDNFEKLASALEAPYKNISELVADFKANGLIKDL